MGRTGYTLVDASGRPIRSGSRRPTPRASYDAAKTGVENQEHWAAASALSAASANSADVRFKLRNRSRYEFNNNGYLKALLTGLANDTVGTGPRLQLSFPDTFLDPDFQRPAAPPEDAAHAVERRWAEWCEAVGLADKLRVADVSESRDGEVFLLEIQNPVLPDDGPQLDLKLIEAEQVATPALDPTDAAAVDGIEFDRYGNPTFYHILKRHPGDTGWWQSGWMEYDRVPASRVYHLFDPDRPGQARGIPAVTAALPLYAIMRRLTLAGLTAAETQAAMVVILESDLPDNPDAQPTDYEDLDTFPISRNLVTKLPAGLKASGFQPTQPGPDYAEFKAEIHTECGRTINAGRNTSTGSSADHNFASGKLDLLPYHRFARIRRRRRERVVLNRLFRVWYREAALIPGYLPAALPPVRDWAARWQWDGFESIDPLKDANANAVLLETGQTTLDDVCAAAGKDWEEVIRQRAKEKELLERYGLPVPGVVPTPAVEVVDDD